MRLTLLCLASVALTSGKVYFFETFDIGWETEWTASSNSGKWVSSSGKRFAHPERDVGIRTGEDRKIFGISASFDSFSTAGKNLIVQYQVKYENDIECGGGYLKLGPKVADPQEFSANTPFYIQFGPEQCGKDPGRTHLIFNYNGKYFRKKVELPYVQQLFQTTHLYRLLLRPDNSVRVEINGHVVYDGHVVEDWETPGGSELIDHTDKKPRDWVDAATIPDPEDKKPDDWVTERQIVNTAVRKPVDWDDEEDGDWEPPLIPNPQFKGAWSARRIPNPAYKGEWTPRTTPNPNYAVIDGIVKYDDISFVGFDIWQQRGGAIFDNIVITDDAADAYPFWRMWRDLRVEEMKVGKDKEIIQKLQDDELRQGTNDFKRRPITIREGAPPRKPPVRRKPAYLAETADPHSAEM